MLDTSAPNLYLEIEQAVRLRDAITTKSQQRHRQYVGSTWMEGISPEVEAHESHTFDFSINTLPFLVYSNPAVKVSSKRPKVHRQLAQGLTHGVNRWIRDVGLETTLLEIGQDSLFDYGVGLVTMEPLPGYENKEAPPMRPCFTRISPRRYFQDPQANSKRSVRYQGHDWLRDIEDLRKATEPDPENPGKRRKVYNEAVLDRLEGMDDSATVGTMRIGDPPASVTRVPRKQIRGYEVYVPEEKKIYTLAVVQTSTGEAKAEYLREPRPAFCHPGGPYVLYGIYSVPDYAFPLAPMATTDNLVEELNAHLDQCSRQADAARQFTIVDGTNAAAVNQIKNAKDLDVICVPGFSANQALVVTIGGPSREQLDYSDRLRARLDRKSGLADFSRGNVTGDATATENRLAAQATDVRRKFMQRNFRLCVVETLTKVLWLMTESKNIVFNVPVPKGFHEGLDDQSAGNGEMEDGLFLGGRHEQDGEDFSFFDLELVIEPMSMELQDEALYREQLQQAFALVIQAAPLMMQFPFVNWPAMLDDLFEASNIKDGRKYINFAMVEQMLQMQFQAGQEQQVQGIDGAQAAPPGQLKAGGKGQFGPWLPGGSGGMNPSRGGASPDVSKLAAMLKGRAA